MLLGIETTRADMTQNIGEMRRQRNQRGEGARLKQELVEAAMRILDRQPGAQLSLRMVAKEAGIAAPSVYRQFPDARAMITEIVSVCWAQMGCRIAQAAAVICAEDPMARLKAQLSAYVQYAMERPSRYQLLFTLSSGVEHDLEGPLRPAFRLVREAVEAVRAGGRALPTDDSGSTTLLTLSMVHGRIALAHLAPMRAGNSASSVHDFVLQSLLIMFPDNSTKFGLAEPGLASHIAKS
jgi:AcrR family transcriptional regulator